MMKFCPTAFTSIFYITLSIYHFRPKLLPNRWLWTQLPFLLYQLMHFLMKFVYHVTTICGLNMHKSPWERTWHWTCGTNILQGGIIVPEHLIFTFIFALPKPKSQWNADSTLTGSNVLFFDSRGSCEVILRWLILHTMWWHRSRWYITLTTISTGRYYK